MDSGHSPELDRPPAVPEFVTAACTADLDPDTWIAPFSSRFSAELRAKVWRGERLPLTWVRVRELGYGPIWGRLGPGPLWGLIAGQGPNREILRGGL